MPGIEDFLEDARAEALWVMRDTAALRAQGAGDTRPEKNERLRAAWEFRRSLNGGLAAAGEGVSAVLDATGGTPGYVSQALAGGQEEERARAEPHPGLVRMRENFRAVADLCSSLPPGQHQQVRDHVLASYATAARGVAAAQVPVGEEQTGATAAVAGRLSRLADLANSMRSSRGFPELSERVAMTGVPSRGDFHAALATWARLVQERMVPTPGGGVSSDALRVVASTAARVSAAGAHAASAEGLSAQIVEQWKDHARAWVRMGEAWSDPVPVMGGRRDAAVLHASAGLNAAIAARFQSGPGQWLSLEELSRGRDLRRAELVARQAMTAVSAAYGSSVRTAVSSEVLLMPRRALSRAEAPALDASERLTTRAWVAMPKGDPVAAALVRQASEVEQTGRRLPSPSLARPEPGSFLARAVRPARPGVSRSSPDRGRG